MQEFIKGLSFHPHETVLYLLGFFAVCNVIFLFLRLARTKSFIKNSVITNAKVVDTTWRYVGRRRYLDLTVVFKDELGAEISSKATCVVKEYEVGDVVEILYLKNDSSQVKLNNFYALYLRTWLSFAAAMFGVGFCAFVVLKGMGRV